MDDIPIAARKGLIMPLPSNGCLLWVQAGVADLEVASIARQRPVNTLLWLQKHGTLLGKGSLNTLLNNGGSVGREVSAPAVPNRVLHDTGNLDRRTPFREST
jgi:hypothetical protein